MATQYYIGTSGWHYEHWRGRFYPEGLPKAKWLEYYARHFSTVEVNNTFYRLLGESTFAGWRQGSPDGFTFALKASRYISHIKRLKGTEEAVGRFIDRARILKEKLGPILYQLPPNMQRNDERLASFLASLPGGLKHVVEFRHRSWIDDEVFKILGGYGAGLCVFDMPSLSCPLVATTDFAYVRFHGGSELYASCYTDSDLAHWAEMLAGLAWGLKSVYIYFNNDMEAFAVKNAKTLAGYLGAQVF